MSTETLWWIALAVGAVVLVVVLVLLHMLYRAVCRIDDRVLSVWMVGKQVARNTATTWMLGLTAGIASEIKDEALRHAGLLAGDSR